MTPQIFKLGGRLWCPVWHQYGTPNSKLYVVDVSPSNPGPMVIGGDLVGLSPADYAQKPILNLEEATEHVRVYGNSGARVWFVGVWCPYSKAIEKPGYESEYLGLPQHMVHKARSGRLWCAAPEDYCEVQ